jgi:hypothetical protein
MPEPVTNVARDLATLVAELPAELSAIPEDRAAQKRADGGWSRKQVLGHLIDSATVNHQRFVRAQVEAGFSLLYDADRWVDLHQYQTTPWRELITLWAALNSHILRVIEHIPPDALGNLCGSGGEHSWTLSYRVNDYVQHLKHHVEQIRGFEKQS